MSSHIRTVIVDDEPLARLRLRTLLAEHADFHVVAECGDGPEALEVIARDRPDLVFLDVQMVTMDGVEVARALDRLAGDGVPPIVVFVTAYDQYAVHAFATRALDYLLKPFDEERFADTLRRVRAQRSDVETRDAHGRLLTMLRDLSRGELPAASTAAQRAAQRAADAVLSVAGLAVDVRARVVHRGGVAVTLRPKEFELLVALIKRAGDVVTRRTLLQEVWGYSEDVTSRTIDTHVSELRRKLRLVAGQPGHIATVARTGYRLEL